MRYYLLRGIVDLPAVQLIVISNKEGIMSDTSDFERPFYYAAKIPEQIFRPTSLGLSVTSVYPALPLLIYLSQIIIGCACCAAQLQYRYSCLLCLCFLPQLL
jgi:hypothetical protein